MEGREERKPHTDIKATTKEEEGERNTKTMQSEKGRNRTQTNTHTPTQTHVREERGEKTGDELHGPRSRKRERESEKRRGERRRRDRNTYTHTYIRNLFHLHSLIHKSNERTKTRGGDTHQKKTQTDHTV